jgi:hypothetical protein
MMLPICSARVRRVWIVAAENCFFLAVRDLPGRFFVRFMMTSADDYAVRPIA